MQTEESIYTIPTEDEVQLIKEYTENGDVAGMQGLIDSGIDILLKIEGGGTSMHYASYYNKPKIIELIYNARGQETLTVKNDIRSISMHSACQNDAIEAVEILMEKGGKDLFYSQDVCLNTPIHNAAASGSLECLRFIKRELGKDALDVKGDQDSTPIYAAIQKREWKVIKFLIKAGVDLDAELNDKRRTTPNIMFNRIRDADIYLMISEAKAQRRNEDDHLKRKELARHREEAEKRVKAKEKKARDEKAQQKKEEAKPKRDKEERLRKNKKEEKAFNNEETRGREGIIREWQIFNSQMEEHASRLELMREDEIEFAKFKFIEEATKPRRVERGTRALHLAASAGNTQAVIGLMESHPEDIDSENIFGFTPLKMAEYKGNSKIVEILRNASNKTTQPSR